MTGFFRGQPHFQVAPPPLPPVPPLPPLPAVPAESWWRKNLATVVVSVAATLSSAVVAYHATAVQASSARQQSAEEFQRNQARDAYNALLNTLNKLDDVESGLVPENLRAPLEIRTGPVRENSDKLLAAASDFNRAVAGVELADHSTFKMQ